MNKILNAVIMGLISLSLHAQGNGYNPANPGDPNAQYQLAVIAAPSTGGEVYPKSSNVEVGAIVSCEAIPNTGYEFSKWMVGDSIVSLESEFDFKMPDHSEVLTAYFDFTGYNPSNPGDPSSDGFKHKVTLYAEPSFGGDFNESVFYMNENDRMLIYAWPSDGYKFIGWASREMVVSTSNPLEIEMGKSDMTFTAKFTYDPPSPINPSAYDYDSDDNMVKVYSPESRFLSSLPREVFENSYNALGISISGNIGIEDISSINELAEYYQLLDLKETSGLSAIPAEQFYNDRLLCIILPATLTHMEKNCFIDCSKLAEIQLYATNPPIVTGDSISHNQDLIIRVPAQSLQLYNSHPVFGKYTVLPLTDEIAYIKVNLPEIVTNESFDNSKISLKNLTTGQIVTYHLKNKTAYTFTGLLKQQTYLLEVKTNSGAILNDPITIFLDESKTVDITELKTPIDVALHLTDTNGREILDGFEVRWFDEAGNHISTGTSLEDRIEDENVVYQIVFDASLYPFYLQLEPCKLSITNNEKDIIVKLTPRERKTVTGKIVSINNIPISNVLVDMRQIYGDYTARFTSHTDNLGLFSIEIPKYPSSVKLSCAGYTSESLELSESQVYVDQCLRNSSGYCISMDVLAKGGTDETSDANDVDMNDFDVQVINKSSNEAVQNFLFDNGHILFESGVAPGNVLEITVSSQSNSFKTIVQEVTIPQKGYCNIALALERYGSVELHYSNYSNSEELALLYDEVGVLRRQSPLLEKTVFECIPDGKYFVVCIENSLDISKLSNYSNLETIGLICNKDFIMFEVVLHSQKNEVINVDQIPDLNLNTGIIDTANSMTKISTPRSTVGSMQTISIKYKLLSLDGNESSDYDLMVELPENVVIEPNSLISKNNRTVDYDIEDNRITIGSILAEDTYKLCITPVLKGQTPINAYLVDKFKRKHILGSVETIVDDASIYFRNYTGNADITVSGNAAPNSEVEIVYNGSTICKTISRLDGLWTANFHILPDTCAIIGSVCAKMTSPSGTVYNTEKKALKYDPSYPSLTSLQMIYNKESFDFFNAKSGASYYSYDPYSDNTFIFKAEFSDNSSDLIDLVKFQILCSDGRTRLLDAFYDDTVNGWVASCKFNNTSILPINLNIDYKIVQNAPAGSYYSKQETYKSIFKDIVDFQTNYNVDDISMISDTDGAIIMSYKVSEEELVYFRLRLIEKNELKSLIDIDDNATTNIEFTDEIYTMQFGEQDILPTLYIWNDDHAFILDMSPDVSDLNGSPMSSKVLAKGDSEKKYKLMKWYHDHKSLYTFTYSNHIVPMTMKEAAELDAVNTVYNEEIGKLIYRYNKLGWLSDLEKGMYEAQIKHLEDVYQKPDSAFDALAYHVPATAIELSKYMEMQEFKYGALSKCLIMTGGLANLKIELFQSTPNNKVCGASIKKLVNGYEQYTFAGFNFSHEVETYEFNPLGLISSIKERDCAWQIIRGNNKLPELLPLTLFPKIKTNTILKEFHKTIRKKRRSEEVKCDKLEVTEKMITFSKPPIEPIIDPSGFVYEGIPSNRLEGVKATVYYQRTAVDETGVVNTEIVPWSASQYGQENPIYTDKNGMYSWNVPQGLWQVKFEKDGYEPAYSEWLPVPPPQLDVNIGMTQMSQPEVKQVNAYADGIDIEFDKYMLAPTLNPENITVKIGNKTVSGSILLQNENNSINEASLELVNKLRFEPDNTFYGETVELTISDMVTSYAGIKMADPFVKTFVIEPEIKEILVNDEFSVVAGESLGIEVLIRPADAAIGKTLIIDSRSPIIAQPMENELIVGENGSVMVPVSGLIPGTTFITFTIKDYDINKTIRINVIMKDGADVVATPVASVESSVVVAGTEVYLSCETENAVIFYTLDGSSPRGESRKQYSGSPIVITHDTTLKVMAEAEGMIESEIAEYQYSIDTSGIGEIDIDCDLNIYPLPLGEYLNISNGDFVIESVSIINLNGSLMLYSAKPEKQVLLRVGSLPSGVYILSVETNGKAIVKKVVKP